MSLQNPPTLQQMALQISVNNEPLVMSALAKQEVPATLFPLLLEEANTQRRAKIVKALVAGWPYPYLPAGFMMKNLNLETYQALLDGLDSWLERMFHPERKTLKLVELRNLYLHLWTTKYADNSMDTLPKNQEVKQSEKPERELLKVVTELQLPLDEYQTRLLQWAKKRQNSVQLQCVKLFIGSLEFYEMRPVLNKLKPEFIMELELNTVCNVSILANLVPFIEKLINLEKVILTRVFKSINITDRDKECVTKFIPLFSKLSSLRHLNIHDVYFLRDHMEQLLRCLKTSLESLSISRCEFSQSDLDSFAQWSHCQLKHLYLRGVSLRDLNFMPLKCFLESVADTLQILELEDCRMEDADLRVLLPALSQCSLLTCINFMGNDFSTNVLKVLLHHTAKLSQLTRELYPAPKEVYNRYGYVKVDKFSQRCAELMKIVITLKDSESVCFGSNACSDCGQRYFYKLETTRCDCQPYIRGCSF